MIQREKYMSVIRKFIDKPVIKVLTGMKDVEKVHCYNLHMKKY